MKRDLPNVLAFLAGFLVAVVASCALLEKGAKDAATLPPPVMAQAETVPDTVAVASAKAASGDVVGAIQDVSRVLETVDQIARQRGSDDEPIGYAGALAAIAAIVFTRFRRILPEWMVGPSASGAKRPKKNKAATPAAAPVA